MMKTLGRRYMCWGSSKGFKLRARHSLARSQQHARRRRLISHRLTHFQYTPARAGQTSAYAVGERVAGYCWPLCLLYLGKKMWPSEKGFAGRFHHPAKTACRLVACSPARPIAWVLLLFWLARSSQTWSYCMSGSWESTAPKEKKEWQHVISNSADPVIN